MKRTLSQFSTSALRLSWALVLVLALLWLVHTAQAVGSTAIEVDIVDDIKKNDGLCSLREAIIAANSDKPTGGCTGGRGADTILLPAGIYILSRTDNGNADRVSHTASVGEPSHNGDPARSLAIDHLREPHRKARQETQKDKNDQKRHEERGRCHNTSLERNIRDL